jgi:hypothetical protein
MLRTKISRCADVRLAAVPRTLQDSAARTDYTLGLGRPQVRPDIGSGAPAQIALQTGRRMTSRHLMPPRARGPRGRCAMSIFRGIFRRKRNSTVPGTEARNVRSVAALRSGVPWRPTRWR